MLKSAITGVGLLEIFFLLLFIAFWLGVMLLLRSFFLWYWKINTVIKHQETQIELLRELVRETKGEPISVEEKARRFDQSRKS